MLIPVEQINEARIRYFEPSIEKTVEPDVVAHEDRHAAADGKSTADVRLTPDQNLEKRKDMLVALAQEPVDFALERAIGNNDSVYSNFC